MTTTHKIFEELCEEEFTLWALHSSLEDHTLVYALNDHLKTRFKRAPSDLDISKAIAFPYFEWKDEAHDQYWRLISNKSRVRQNLEFQDLFRNEPAYTAHHLLPEYRDVDYLIKIEGELLPSDEDRLALVKRIPGMITAYSVNTENLKSRKNLTF
ncbi:IPExxxVDY family protein [Zeaxanthinibacter sp. PT1]|uniref:IPExxxVDY family protein n=1 Tax=Zeaxanthinibacter TaxID=561554 RepID=UPI00234BF0CB|nr:IPExxxVDY family protein [Zeaxanthinibacter sp. PT1]MDC6350850.1 IPExxxVDY family protein [Zeaxanthinibacter sp. PT1]